MRIEILDKAQADLEEGFRFYEAKGPGLGLHFLSSLSSDIDSLENFAGVHAQPYGGFHRLLSRRFPFAVYYKVRAETAFVHAVVDCRRKPAWIRRHLR